MKELKEIAHRITQCDEVGVAGGLGGGWEPLSGKAIFVNLYI